MVEKYYTLANKHINFINFAKLLQLSINLGKPEMCNILFVTYFQHELTSDTSLALATSSYWTDTI